jgi:hypothetical protein
MRPESGAAELLSGPWECRGCSPVLAVAKALENVEDAALRRQQAE